MGDDECRGPQTPASDASGVPAAPGAPDANDARGAGHLMGTAIVLVAVAAAIGVGLVVYGTVRAQQSARPEDSVRATYRTLADVREQLRRRFEPTGTPVWIAAEQVPSRLQRDLVSADIELRPYEFRIIQLGAAILFA